MVSTVKREERRLVLSVRQPAEGDVSHNVYDSQDRHEEGSILLAEAIS